MSVLLDKSGNGSGGIARVKGHLGDMAQHSVGIIQSDGLADIVMRIGGQSAFPGNLEQIAGILAVNFCEAFEGVKSPDFAMVIQRLHDCAEMSPRHQASAAVDSTLDDVSMHGQHML